MTTTSIQPETAQQAWCEALASLRRFGSRSVRDFPAVANWEASESFQAQATRPWAECTSPDAKHAPPNAPSNPSNSVESTTDEPVVANAIDGAKTNLTKDTTAIAPESDAAVEVHTQLEKQEVHDAASTIPSNASLEDSSSPPIEAMTADDATGAVDESDQLEPTASQVAPSEVGDSTPPSTDEHLLTDIASPVSQDDSHPANGNDKTNVSGTAEAEDSADQQNENPESPALSHETTQPTTLKTTAAAEDGHPQALPETDEPRTVNAEPTARSQPQLPKSPSPKSSSPKSSTTLESSPNRPTQRDESRTTSNAVNNQASQTQTVQTPVATTEATPPQRNPHITSAGDASLPLSQLPTLSTPPSINRDSDTHYEWMLKQAILDLNLQLARAIHGNSSATDQSQWLSDRVVDLYLENMELRRELSQRQR